ncbi:uncharacterized protein LOC114945716 [Nylanderia fulva]|uniref:uncharacterized protein LOC114945716 n=1 Tax=Nylanderia fulva TaxID=613905 RepID=UPI0010FB60C5|nr:uncharacterized protein LOC114945716 [Nylanderia fulva]
MCIISSICLPISTVLKIGCYKKDHRLIDSESKCYNDNKKWFNLYLKLFIVLFILIGIKWLMLTAEVLSENVSIFNSYVFDLLDIMHLSYAPLSYFCGKKGSSTCYSSDSAAVCCHKLDPNRMQHCRALFPRKKIYIYSHTREDEFFRTSIKSH